MAFKIKPSLCPSCKAFMYGWKCSCGFVKVTPYLSLSQYFECYSSNPGHPAYGRDFREIDPYKIELSVEILDHAEELLKKVNSLFTELSQEAHTDFELQVTSGWRPKLYSKEIGLSTRSHHCYGRAIDILDIGNSKWNLLKANLSKLANRGLAIEHKSATKTWLHIQSRLPRSGRTIFYP